jgi:transcriptional regulator with XRE-family HTH domain
MKQFTLGELVFEKRKEKGLTQNELASLCNLDNRTIQRIEKGEVKPYFSTLKLLSQVLECDLIQEINSKPWQFSTEEENKYRKMFKKRRTLRVTLMVIALASLLGVATTFPSFRLFGMAKLSWAPFFYLFMFALIITIGLTWRCPVCHSSLGNPFSTRFCSKCGFKFL